MAQRLSWSKIRELFHGQWVELTDCEWDWSNPYPRWAKVGRCAESRDELIHDVSDSESLVLYVGGTEFMIRQHESQVSL